MRNDSSQPVTHLDITGPITFEFDGDGLCNNASGAVPTGCRTPAGSTGCGTDKGACAFPPPPGEPASYREFGAAPGTPPFANGDVQNGYEGPMTWFSNVAPSPNNSGTVNFSPPLAPGASTYFSLEAVPQNFPATTAVSATQSGAGMSGARLYLPSGVTVVARASVTGGAGPLTGSAVFQWFRSSRCTGATSATYTGALGAGAVAMARMRLGRPGTYYSQVRYSGGGNNGAAQTRCGTGVIVVPRRGSAGLPTNRRCVTTVTSYLHVGRAHARSVLAFANGRLVGRFGTKIRVRIRRRMSIAVIAATRAHAFGARGTPGRLVQQSRTYRAC